MIGLKRVIPCVLLLALLLGLTGCGAWIKNTYRTAEAHREVTTVMPVSTQETPTAVSTRNELRGAILSFIRDWTEHGVIEVRGYLGDIDADLAETVRYATQEDPVGAYAVDYANVSLQGDGEAGSIDVNIVFRRSAAEVASIVTVSDTEAALNRIRRALLAGDAALTLRIRDYRRTDVAAFVRSYCLENPQQIIAIPTLSADIYPDRGETRILELHFTYPETRDAMALRLESVNTILHSAAAFLQNGKTPTDRTRMLCRFLLTRFSYRTDRKETQMPAYSLLSDGIATSAGFASVFYAECTEAGIPCLLVSGTRDGVSHEWNMVRLEGKYYHIDLMRSVEKGETGLTLLLDDEMKQEGYRWKAADYPQTEKPEIDEPRTEEPTADEPDVWPTQPPTEPPKPTEESTEPTEPTVPETEPTEPTENSEIDT